MLTNKLTGAGAADKTYIEDVFSTYLYTGNGSTQTINNGIALADGPANGVTLHLTGDTLTDSAPVPNTLTVFGNTQVSTSVKKYGTGSLYFDGSGDYLNAPTGSSTNFGTGDFTIEGWFYRAGNGTHSGFLETIMETRTSDVNNGGGFAFGTNSSNQFVTYGCPINTGPVATGSFTAGQWNHFAISQQSGTVKVFINGSQVYSASNSGANYNHGGLWVATAGAAGAGNYTFNGYIDDLRITKGYARYTANFTPPTQALPLDTLVAGKGGLLWIKARSSSTLNNVLLTSIFPDKYLNSGSTGLLGNAPGWSLDSTGFTLPSTSTLNGSGSTYASWTFRKAPKFFDVVTYTGNGTTQTINHSLGVAPGMIIIKATNGTGDWSVYHTSVGNQKYLTLNTVNAVSGFDDRWNYTSPTSTQFTVNSAYSGVNTNGVTYVAYLFAHDTTTDGLIQCGSFTTDASGAYSVTLGWEPQYVMVKASSTTGNWIVADNMRGMGVSTTNNVLNPNLSSAESTFFACSPSATGFYATSGTPTSDLTANTTYIYMAIRRGPMRTPTDGTKVFQPLSTTGTGTTSLVSTTITPDLVVRKTRTYLGGAYWLDRMRDNVYLQSSSAGAEINNANIWPLQMFDNQLGFDITGTNLASNSTSHTYANWVFKRAPGFFDVVCYTGTGSVRTVNHNLGVTPEFVIVKGRSTTTYNWFVSHKDLGSSGNTLNDLYLNTTAIVGNTGNFGTLSTSSVLSLRSASGTNQNGQTYVAYLFASCPGVSKVGTYTGNGTSQNINCGFTNGARFVLVKCTSTTGNWLVFDTARGIIAAADPTLGLNATDSEASVDYIDPYSAGFAVTGTNNDINGSGQTYIYLAIA